ncbi:hypothetical protein [Paenibacillus alvei]|nr:hypothetical protein [Paenibacillus alvei]
MRSIDEIEKDMYENNVTPDTIDDEIERLENELIGFFQGGAVWSD